ncbi:hypothetical protein L228DRAFT_247387 [Xylona heveae TC161]|uniref:Rho1 guanine nucleotide exchange factor 3 n=1 Tax=Xylona heveae (strain CBS 132557 / TC161) TaxID=1328760 RepID=A0A165H461_XYLHT|nr:hypothetical protein L228DRAFT_247387 [Xylona heveae TC161]KZF22961.1 hypothetical protein L228DRAFT_247387 [Xylona heveae TC161]
MSYYRNGQNFHFQQTATAFPPPPRSGGLQSPTQPFLERSPSFDRGDDASYVGESAGRPSEYGTMMGGNEVPRSNQNTLGIAEEPYMGGSNPPSGHPPPAPYIPTGHQPQYQATSPPGGYTAYSSQQYPVPPSEYNPAAYGSVNATQGPVHQPYNPAAYRSSSFSYQATSPNSVYGASPTSFISSTSYPSPALAYVPQTPPQRHDSQYSHPSRPSPYVGSTSAPYAPYQPISTTYASYSPEYAAHPPQSARRGSDYFDIDEYYAANSPQRSNSQSYSLHSPASSFDSKRMNLQHHSLPSPPQHGSQTVAGVNGLSGAGPGDDVPPIPPQHSPQRTNTTGRHPQLRPLPGPPPDASIRSDLGVSNGGSAAPTMQGMVQDNVWTEVEEELMRADSRSRGRRRSPVAPMGRHSPIHEEAEPDPLFASSITAPTASHHISEIDEDLTNGIGSSDAYSEGSDAEAAAGLAALRMEEEREMADRAHGRAADYRLFPGYGPAAPEEHPVAGHESDSDYAHVDMGLYGGGYDVQLHYGDDPSIIAAHTQEDVGPLETPQRPLPMPDVPWSTDERFHEGIYDDLGQYGPDSTGADGFGMGGLSEPTPERRRLSFEEGDEGTLVDAQGFPISPSALPSQEYPELFYHPGMSSQRPLPSVSAASTAIAPEQHDALFDIYDARAEIPPSTDTLSYLSTADSRASTLVTPSGTMVPRSSSLSSYSSTPQAIPPIRSKTDADERPFRLSRQQQMNVRLAGSKTDSVYDSSAPQSTVALDLPEIPMGKVLNPAKLSTSDFKKCSEPWALSSVVSWLRQMSEGSTDLKEQTVVDGIVALFTHKVPTMNVADAETLAALIVKQMLKHGVLVYDEEWVKFTSETMSGVIYQLTGTGCYSPRVHMTNESGRCYASHCQRTLKKVNLQAHALEPQKKLEDWVTFYKIKMEDLEGVNKKEIERQNILHEIVQTEDQFMDQLDVVRQLYRDQLRVCNPPIISPKRIQQFLSDVFGKVDAIQKVNEDYLLAQLKYRQQEQGPWIVGFSGIFREWIRKAKAAYIDYAASFPNASFLIRKESERNVLFRQFLDQISKHERSKRLGWDTYVKAPITRLQRYSLLLGTVHKNMLQETEEKSNLLIAMGEIKDVTLECDARVAEMSKKVDLLELGTKLVLRPGMERVELNLNHLGRELIFKGELQRLGANRFTWLDTYAMLFDHYLVLAKIITVRDAVGIKHDRYDVSKLPIPMDLLVLESTSDDPVVKSSVKGIGTATAVSTRPQAPTATVSSASGLTQTTSNSSANGVMVTNTVLEGYKEEKILYPFRLKHLGKSEVYTLYAPTAQSRQDWCEKIIEAKTKHAASLYAQNAEPFRLRVMADTAFAYDSLYGGSKSVIISGTPLDRAIREVEQEFEHIPGPRPGPVCRASVNCATTFTQSNGTQMVAVGTDYGIYLAEHANPRGWNRIINIPRVSQVAVLEEFSLMLLISDKSLIAYHLDAVCPVNGTPPPNDSARRAPQKLSGTRDVGFFAMGHMKDRMLVFYKKREGLSSTFKVLEPIFQKSTEKKHRFLRKGATEFFREFDEFYIPTECFGLNLFHSSLSISTHRGFEVLTLDKKQPWSVPDLKAPHVATIASRVRDQKPLGMFRLSETEFLLCYEECAVYVNKHGDVSRSVIMEFVGKAKSAALFGPYILLFDQDFVEIRNAQNGRLRQVIAGKDVRCLDDAQHTGGVFSGGKRSVKVALQHPEMERSQIVVELLLNEGLKE